MWRWNEFLRPLLVLTKTRELYTLQIGLNAFQGELQTQWHYLLGDDGDDADAGGAASSCSCSASSPPASPTPE